MKAKVRIPEVTMPERLPAYLHEDSLSRRQIAIKFICSPGKLHSSRDGGSILPGLSINKIMSASTRHQSLWDFQIL